MTRNNINRFEVLARRAHLVTEQRNSSSDEHPFEERNIHEQIARIALPLFDDGHYAQAALEAWKLLDKVIQKLSSSSESGFKLMMATLSEASPVIRLNGLISQTDKDEQKGFQFLFAGGVMAIRNPRAHEINIKDDPDTCLDHLSIASFLLRRLESAGHDVNI